MNSPSNNDELFELIQLTIRIISKIEGVIINQHRLVDDVFALAVAFNDPKEFELSAVQVIDSLKKLVAERVSGKELSGNLSDWDSYHFQSKRENKHSADLRIAYQRVGENQILVRGFGHRRLPSDFYKRMYGR